MVDDAEHPEQAFDGIIVALGASAGGLDALDRFFRSLPALDSTAFVVIQHLAPEHKTMMDTLLARHTEMRVTVATDGAVLEGAHVYVIPPGTTMTVSESRLRLVPRPSTGVTLPIDAFFESLATEAPTRSIGIVLSGTGSDGTKGIIALDQAGSWVLAQDPETAKFGGMPLSALATGAVDHVLDPESLAAEVATLVASGQGPPERQPGVRLTDHGAIEQVCRMLASTMRIDFSQYKPTTVLRRVERRMQATGRETIGAYRELLVSDHDEVDTLRRELLIPVTWFFRDPEAFGALTECLEQLVKSRAGDRDRPLRIWVTPCSTGEEAYSIAMVLLDLVEQHAPGLGVKLFATDVEAHYVERASSGVFTDAQMANVPDDVRDRWFEVVAPGSWRCRPTLRSHIVFSRHDLLIDAPFTQLDLVACRNLLIYLRPAAQDRALRRLSYALRSGGILFLGTSENPGASADDYEAIDARQKLYRLVRRAASLPPGDLLGDSSGRGIGLRRSTPEPLPPAPVVAPVHRALEELSRQYAPPSLIVTAGRRLVHTFGDTRDLLRFSGGDVSLDVVNLLPPPLTPVVGALLHGALRVRAPQRSTAVPVTLDDGAGGERTVVYYVSVWPILGDGESVEHLIVSFEPPADDHVGGRADVTESDISTMSDRHVADLERELALTRGNLQDTIQKLGTANEELQATNEEMMAANEELQSTNEELQSVNEELHTVNAEYQSKIAELNDVYADLESLTKATRIPLVFLDADLRLTRFTPAATALFRFRAADIGRPITDFSHSLDFPDLYEVLRRTRDDHRSVQREVVDHEDRTWLFTALSYAPHGAQDTRLVITCVDVSSMRDVQRLQSTLDALPEHVAVLSRDGEILMVNRSWSEFASANGGAHLACTPGSNYLDACRLGSGDDPSVRRLLAGLEGVLSGHLPSYVTHHPWHTPTERRWFLMHAIPVDDGGCVVTHFDVTGWIDPDRIAAEVMP